MRFFLFKRKPLLVIFLLPSICFTFYQALTLISQKSGNFVVRQEEVVQWTKQHTYPLVQEMTKQQTTSEVANTYINASAIESRFLRRRLLADSVCARYQPNYVQARTKTAQSGFVLRNMIASLDKRAVMCYTLKAGSSTWHDIFWHFREPEAAKTEPFFGRAVYGNEKHFRSLSVAQRRQLFTDPNTVKLMSIRHPFSRLISGWEDKFNKEYYYSVLFKRNPRMKDYPSEYGRWNGTGQFMSWKSFIQYMADYGPMDEHFKVTPCDVCTFPYDFIIKMETFPTSSDWLMREKLHCVHPRRRNMSNGTRLDPVKKIKSMYSVLNRERIEKLVKLYRREMDIYGYTFDVETLTAGGWDD